MDLWGSYRRIDKADPANPVVTDEVVYMTADEEDNYHVAQANEPLDEEDISFIRMYPVVSVKKHRNMRSACLTTWTYLLRWYSP